MSIKPVMLSHPIFLCFPLLLLSSIFPRVFSNESALSIRWPMCWSFSISLSNEYSALISFRINWFDILSSKGILSLFQHHNLKASFLWCSAVFMVQLSHPYMITGKTIASTIWIFLFIVPSKVVIFLLNWLIIRNSMTYGWISAYFSQRQPSLLTSSNFYLPKSRPIFICSSYKIRVRAHWQLGGPSLSKVIARTSIPYLLLCYWNHFPSPLKFFFFPSLIF